MAVLVEMHHTGDPALRSEVVATIEHVFADRAGDWRVSIVGSQANDRWEMHGIRSLSPDPLETNAHKSCVRER
jgi:hypothetical protein